MEEEVVLWLGASRGAGDMRLLGAALTICLMGEMMGEEQDKERKEVEGRISSWDG